MLHAGLALAKRLELNHAAMAEAWTLAMQKRRPDAGARGEWFKGGYLSFMGPQSPLTHVLGLGFEAALTPADIDHVEEFFTAAGASANITVCPLADASLIEQLNQRRYAVIEFENVLARPIRPDDRDLTVTAEIREMELGTEGALFSRTAAEGFFPGREPTGEEIDLACQIGSMAGARPFVAFADAQPAATCVLLIREGHAWLGADSTKAQFLRRGLHNSLIAWRIREAARAGCDIVSAEVHPGSQSQRNFERNGFQVLYTRIALTPTA